MLFPCRWWGTVGLRLTIPFPYVNACVAIPLTLVKHRENHLSPRFPSYMNACVTFPQTLVRHRGSRPLPC